MAYILFTRRIWNSLAVYWIVITLDEWIDIRGDGVACCFICENPAQVVLPHVAAADKWLRGPMNHTL